MAGFDLDQLRTLVAVLDAGSLTAAAPRVFLSQSSVSEQMRKLEERAGQPLLLRGKNGVTATPAGLRLLEHARAILALSDAAYRDLRGVPMRGELNLCITDYFRPGDVARMLRRLNEQYPQLRLYVRIMKSGEIESAWRAAASTWACPWSSRRTARRTESRQARCCGANPDVDGGARRAAGMQPAAAAGPARDLCVAPVRRAHPDPWRHRLCRGARGLRRGRPATGAGGGLGVACLNESALAPGIARLDAPDLPALPQAAFRVLPARPGEDAFVARAREVITQALR